MSSLKTVREFLANMKTCHPEYIPRKKNQETRHRMGLTIDDMNEVVMGLDEYDYHKGPVPDQNPDFSGHIWVFKKIVYGESLYFKLKIIKNNDGRGIVKIISSHIDDDV